MRWGDMRESENVEDRTSGSPSGGGGFGLGGGGMRIGGGALILIVIVGWLFGINPLQMLGLLSGGDGGPPPTTTQVPQTGFWKTRPDHNYEYMAVIALTCSPGSTRSELSVSASVFKSQGESNDERVCRIGRVS